MDFSKQLFRASAIGSIMTSEAKVGLTDLQTIELKRLEGLPTPTDKQKETIKKLIEKRDAKPKMGDTCKTYLKELYREQKYGIKKEFTNKYVEKGLQVEESAIELYSHFKEGFYVKNDEWFSNEFISGTPDIVSDKVIDIKSSWSLFTFPFPNDKVNKMYEYQLQAYMALTGLNSATLAYVLIDTPFQIVEDEKRRLNWKMGIIDSENKEYQEACEEIERSHSFGHIPLSERIVEFEIKRDNELIESIYERVKECRTYLNELEPVAVETN